MQIQSLTLPHALVHPPTTYRAIACRAAHSAAGESACRPLSETLARPYATTAASLSRVLAREDWLGARPPCPTAAAPSRFLGGITGVDVSVCTRVCMRACACDTAVSWTLAIFCIPKSPPDLKETRRTRESTRRVYGYKLAMAYTVNNGKLVSLALDVQRRHNIITYAVADESRHYHQEKPKYK